MRIALPARANARTTAGSAPGARRRSTPRPLKRRCWPAGIARLISSSSVDEGRFVPGTVLAGRYRITGLLGRGGMGEECRATDLSWGRWWR